jgi:hypothetical protein
MTRHAWIMLIRLGLSSLLNNVRTHYPGVKLTLCSGCFGRIIDYPGQDNRLSRAG